MTADEIIEFAAGLPDVAAITAHEGDGSPEVAWGDTFIYYGENRKMPWATIVTKDYEGWDEASNLNRPGRVPAQRVGRPRRRAGSRRRRLHRAGRPPPPPAHTRRRAGSAILNPSDPRDLLTRGHARASKRGTA